MTEPDVVWLLDASAIINIKIEVPGNKQWKLFKKLEAMVERGAIAFPKQIRVEVANMAHPDAPGVWADGVFPQIQHPTEPDAEYLRQVMRSPAKAVVDTTKTREDGDPYLLALALQLTRAGYSCCIVTGDTKTNPTRISIAEACGHLGLDWCRLVEFLTRTEP